VVPASPDTLPADAGESGRAVSGAGRHQAADLPLQAVAYHDPAAFAELVEDGHQAHT
jgi:hypothetical protein